MIKKTSVIKEMGGAKLNVEFVRMGSEELPLA